MDWADPEGIQLQAKTNLTADEWTQHTYPKWHHILNVQHPIKSYYTWGEYSGEKPDHRNNRDDETSWQRFLNSHINMYVILKENMNSMRTKEIF